MYIKSNNNKMNSQEIPTYVKKMIPIQIGNKSIKLPLYLLKDEYYILQSDLVV